MGRGLSPFLYSSGKGGTSALEIGGVGPPKGGGGGGLRAATRMLIGSQIFDFWSKKNNRFRRFFFGGSPRGPPKISEKTSFPETAHLCSILI